MNCGFCPQYPFIDQDALLSITILPIGCYILFNTTFRSERSRLENGIQSCSQTFISCVLSTG